MHTNTLAATLLEGPLKIVSVFQSSIIPQPSREYTLYFTTKDTQIYT